MSLNDQAPTDGPRYARFSRRLKAILLDWMLAMALLFGAVALASNVRSDMLARMLGIAVVVILVLYEPVLVSRLGGTLGHYWTNLRVVDDGGGNLSFGKALARFAIKSLLSWYSFLTMMATRRNQAVHDLLTNSTVRICDLSKASSSQFITERRELEDAAMPSRIRRALVTVVYLAFGGFLYVMALGAVLEQGLLSSACLDRDFCSGGERIVTIAAATVLLVALALVIGMGWSGRLPGARRA
ncbi:RDD family protein [Bradyrhizobium sp. CCGUVB1N3]|uniref:RDD family protein n=1 Tax=Bradyrhizobium sp. CCGUVB1N3 TaxID=2949629 RepID=UPI0020B1F2E3|nr:RDD family protein [Bradyrhizobium sp. CCGUVB1N3]MCP3474071.1 RDD family protein [Bradyrhizobium sp. CCGUVB1N3]